jgi:oligoribonuclease NrnB/cAMP/cGMP phosphodiesterase (DHH superfamily)
MNPPVDSQDVIIIYHGFCTDGFGSAYAAWKKFGNLATYIGRNRVEEPFNPELLRGKDVYVLDYSFPLDEMLSYQDVAKSFVVIDHHVSAEQDVRALTHHVFDNSHSGAYLAWQYFHPETSVPRFIQYISDADIWAHSLPDWKEVESFIYSNGEAHFSFEHFQDLHDQLETEEGYARAKQVGGMLVGAHTEKVAMYAEMAELVSFEGHTVYAVNAPREVRSELGHVLAERTNTFSLIFTYEKGLWKCSLRSVKDFDVSAIATKHGGGGHKNAAAFTLKTNFPLPFAQSLSPVDN